MRNLQKNSGDTKAELRRKLNEALEALEAIRTGQVDALVVQAGTHHQLYTLQSADRAYRAFIENMSEGAVTLHKDGTIDYANAQFGELVSHPLSDIVGHSFSEFIEQASQADFEILMTKCLREQDGRGEIDLRSGDDVIPVLVSITVLQTEESYSFTMIVADLREQKKVQSQLKEQNQALQASNYDLQQFASVASHDLQEPLRKITMFSNILLDDQSAEKSERTKKYLNKINISASRMQQLIIDVLNLSRVSADKSEFKPVDLTLVLQHLLEDFELLIEQKEAVVIVGDLPVVPGNAVQITQAVRNILSNSLKFSKPGISPEVKISATRVSGVDPDSPEQSQGPYCRLCIKDNGIGFENIYIDKIFGLFQRLHNRESYEGTGIGLAITRKIIEQHHGQISASSRPDEGAEFKLTLPMHRMNSDNGL